MGGWWFLELILLLLLFVDETTLHGEVLSFLALAVDFLFFFDAEAVFFFLEVIEGRGFDFDFLNGFGRRALQCAVF